MNYLNEVMTFKEATDYLGRSASYLNNMVATGKLVDGEHYRQAGGSKLILRSTVEQIKLGVFGEDVKMVNKYSVSEVAEEIRKAVLRKKSTPTEYILGGEYIVYLKNGKLNYTATGSAEGQQLMEDGEIVCLIAYYGTPDLKQECTKDAIMGKIEKALADKNIVLY